MLMNFPLKFEQALYWLIVIKYRRLYVALLDAVGNVAYTDLVL
jgi:hypothetical protein